MNGSSSYSIPLKSTSATWIRRARQVKRFYPLIDRMEEHNKTLASILVTLPDGDALKDILNRVLITSVVEVEKFRRGDYS